MFDNLYSAFKEETVHRIGLVVSMSSQVLKTLDQEFKDDKEAKNVAIDTIVELLNKHKS